MTSGLQPGAVNARVNVAIVLFGVEQSKVVVGLHQEDTPSSIAFRFPARALNGTDDPEATARLLIAELVENQIHALNLIGVQWDSLSRKSRPTLLVSYAAACKGCPPVPRSDEVLLFGRVKALRRKYPEFLTPHDEVFRQALKWLFRVVQHDPLVAHMCGPRFTIAELREVYEQVWGIRHIDPSNFHKQVTKPALGFVRKVEDFAGKGPGKPAALYEPGPAQLLNPPMRPPHGDQTSPSIRVLGRDRRGGIR